MVNHNEFAARRQQLMQKMGKNTIAIIAAAPEYIRNGDAHFSYRQNSDFYYLTGFPEPEAVAVLIPDSAENKYILFNRPPDPTAEMWQGKRAGQIGACQDYAADVAYPIAEFSTRLPALLQDVQKVYYPLGQQPELDKAIVAAVNSLQQKVRTGVTAPIEFVDLEHVLHEMRLIKSEAEINLMRKAAQISAQAHRRAMQTCRAGMYEYQLEAELLYEFYRNGSRSPAYNCIVAGGKNSCILHYMENQAELKAGELVLIDAACEYNYYASDITRTFPIDGRFTTEQRAIYELGLAAQSAAIADVRAGTRWDRLQEISERVITEGLIKLGILSGDVETNLQSNSYRAFYTHRLSHWLGMDVHDAGQYKINDEWRELKPGMVFTVEPGIYITANSNVDKKWWNIGVRIEDDVLVTAKGCEVLSAGVPKTVAAIEALMANEQ